MRQTSVFGKRKEPHTVIIARGDEIRHFTVRPWAITLAGSAFAAVAVGYLLATSYLVLRDDLIGATVARQARMQQAYEDRIAALRAQVDRITSRQLLDQQLMEDKVGELLARQAQLKDRHGRIGPLLERTAPASALPAGAEAPLPAARPKIRADAPVPPGFATSFAASAAPAAPWSAGWTFSGEPERESEADRADRLFVAINQSLRSIEAEQMDRIRLLTEDAHDTVQEISATLKSAGLTLATNYGADAGGPLVPAAATDVFDREVAELDLALTRLETVKSEVRKLPLANPAPGQAISSRFGIRRDPILGIRAMHSGLDFRAPQGATARATAPGTVQAAGWNGGYGKMVEILHDNGLSTRYAHLSRILVKEGDRIDLGQAVGAVGSTGRSTGPHLHYEVRLNGEPVDPVRFLKTGKKVADLL